MLSMSEVTKAQNVKRHPRRHAVRVNRVHHRVVIRKAHFRYAHLPKWRTSVTVVPVGALVIKTKTTPYYFHQGVYYAPQNNNYVVVRPAVGVRIRVLPVGYKRIIVGPSPYYYYYGTFYKQIEKSKEYETVGAPIGAIVDALPDGYDVKIIDGTEYYVLDGVYYAEVETDEVEGGIGYEVAKK